MPQVDRRAVRNRATLLRAAGERRLAAFCAGRVGATERVLVEREDIGRTEQFVPVRLSPVRPGEIVEVEIAAAETAGLVGTLLERAA